jgi:hypothetical protein
MVFVDTAPAFQDLRGKFVHLQRFDGKAGLWRFYKKAKLKRNTSAGGSFPYNFTATFTKLARGSTVRVLVPRKTAAPCYLPRASDKVVLR